MDDLTNNPAFLNHMVYQSEAFKIYQRRLMLDTLLFVFDRNYHELRDFLTDAVKPEHIDLLWKQREATVILREVIRLVHNYVASAKMLVDNTRPLIQNWYKTPPSWPNIMLKYEAVFSIIPYPFLLKIYGTIFCIIVSQ